MVYLSLSLLPVVSLSLSLSPLVSLPIYLSPFAVTRVSWSPLPFVFMVSEAIPAKISGLERVVMQCDRNCAFSVPETGCTSRRFHVYRRQFVGGYLDEGKLPRPEIQLIDGNLEARFKENRLTLKLPKLRKITSFIFEISPETIQNA